MCMCMRMWAVPAGFRKLGKRLTRGACTVRHLEALGCPHVCAVRAVQLAFCVSVVQGPMRHGIIVCMGEGAGCWGGICGLSQQGWVLCWHGVA